MSNILKLSIGLCILILSSCSKNNFKESEPDLPGNVEIDINEDGIVDFVINFRYVDIEPFNSESGNFGISGSIDPSSNNQVLIKREEGNLFLRDTEDIKETVLEPLSWSTIGFSKKIISIGNDKDDNWPKKWEISSNSVHSSYFLGLKITDNNLTQLGWLELDINRNNGNVEVIDKGIL